MWIRRVLLPVSLGFNVIGIVLFFKWLIQTDIMFGHYSGPSILLHAATGILALGVAASIWWFGSALRHRMRVAEDPSKKSSKGIIAGVILFLVSAPSALCLFFGILAILDEIGRSRVYGPWLRSLFS